MRKAVPHLFADITAFLEDMHSIAVEGQCSKNSPDMQQVLICQLRMRSAALDAAISRINQRLGEHHD